MNDNYSAGTGGSIYAGISPLAPPVNGWGQGAAVGSVVDGVWTPGRDSNGLINEASVLNLPANTWVQVAGTELNYLLALVEATGFNNAIDNYSPSKDLRRVFVAWVGACDDGETLYFPRGGGHGDSSINCIPSFHMRTMRWGLEAPPSNPREPGFEWHPNYKASGNFTPYRGADNGTIDTDGLYRDIVPNGYPTSAHTYNGAWYDSLRGHICTGRVSRWDWNRTTRQWTRQRWVRNGAQQIFTINQELHYHRAKDTVFGFFAFNDSDYTSFGKCVGGGSVYQAIPVPSTVLWQMDKQASVRLDEDRILFFWWRSSVAQNRVGVFNMATEQFEYAAPIVDARPTPGLSEMTAACLIPAWGAQGQVIRMGVANDSANGIFMENVFYLHDIATRTDLPYEPLGKLPDFHARPGNKPRPMPNTGLAIWFEGQTPINQPAVHVMRYAPL